MKDTNIERSAPGRIPVLSPIAHFVAMTGVVFLRSSFGIDFLRPKSVFFAFSWFFILLTIFIAYYPSLWREYRVVCIFGLGAIALYWLHLAISALRNIQRKAEHSLYGGTSHLLLPLRKLSGTSERLEHILHIWIEPGILVLAVAILRFGFAERHLSLWLIFAAACLLFTELNSFWAEDVRRPNIQDDLEKDAEKQGQRSLQSSAEMERPKATRKDGVVMPRNTGFAEEAERTERYAKLLRLHQPYDLTKAEENYKTLVQMEHPDSHENSAESNAATAELNHAIAFLRDRLGG